MNRLRAITPLTLRRILRTPKTRWERIRAYQTAVRVFPFMADFYRQRARFFRRLQPFYDTYVTEISAPDWAVSLETSALLLYLCETLQPKRLADLGSGFSSFVLRSYATDQDDVVVYSVDDDPDWLKRTDEYLNSVHLQADNVLLWDDFAPLAERTQNFDLIFHDIGKTVRWRAVPDLVRWTTPERGIIVFDDIQRIEYRKHVLTQIAQANGQYLDFAPFTFDSIRRHAGIGCKFSPNP